MPRTTKLLFILTIAVCLVAMAACGGSATTTGATAATSASGTTGASGSTTTSAAGSTTTAAESTTTSASTPSGPGGTAEVESTNGGYPKDNTPNWSEIKSVVAFRSASYGVSSVYVCLSTYEINPTTLSEFYDLPSPEPGQGRLELVFTRTLANENEPPLVAGAYDFATPQGKAELTGAASIVVEKGTSVTFDQSSTESDVEITAVSDTEISGTFSVKDKWSKLSGSFTAPIK